MKLYSYKQVINEYTHVTDTSKTLIDHIYVKNMNYVQESTVPKLSLSDHLCCLLHMKKHGLFNKSDNNNLITCRKTCNFNEEEFNSMNKFISLNEETSCVDVMVNELSIDFNDILEACIEKNRTLGGCRRFIDSLKKKMCIFSLLNQSDGNKSRTTKSF